MIDAKTVEELRGLLAADTSTDWQTIRADPAKGADVWWICAKNAAGQEVELGSLQGGFPHPTREVRARLIVAMRNALPAMLDALSASLAREGEDWIGTAQQGFKAWKAKPHNARWFRKIDGTPIPNDLTICIGEAFAARIRALAAENEALRKGRREEELREDARLGAALARAESSESLVTELREKVERLTKALEPFAKRAERYDPDEADDGEPDWSTASPSIRIGDLRRARSELEGR